MPGFNGTGPNGAGPMYGRGRGYCRSYPGTGFGPGFRGNSGRGQRYGYNNGITRRVRLGANQPAAEAVSPFPVSNNQELELLKEQFINLKVALEQANRRINELENKN